MSKSILLQGEPGSILIHVEKDKMVRTPGKAIEEVKGKEVFPPVADSHSQQDNDLVQKHMRR